MIDFIGEEILNQMKKEVIKLKYKPRNPVIQSAFKREINLQPQVHKDKKKYTRKTKHKKFKEE